MPTAKEMRLQGQSLSRLAKLRPRTDRKDRVRASIARLQASEAGLQAQIKDFSEAGKDTSRPQELLAKVQKSLLKLSTVG